ncbi:MAG: type II toxin-antitoxin system RelE/ParE family toxin [Alphaproteobacteria bacterium]
MPTLKWLPEALADLDRLLGFLRERDLRAANRAALTIRRHADALRTARAIGSPMHDGSIRRQLVIPFGARAYVLPYRLDAEGNVVVIRVWHGRERRD